MPKVSIVIPVYNVEKYLRQCLESIISQTLKDIEIICVNDGSTDSSLEILQEYEKKDKRIKVITKANAGYGHSMNMGMTVATGEYMGIVDSDDYILPNMYETLYDFAKHDDLDFIRGDYWHWFCTPKANEKRYCKSINGFYNKVYCPREVPEHLCSSVLTCSGIYKLSFLKKNEICYSETPGASFQDQGFWFKTTIMADRAMFVNQAFYMYRFDNPNSSINSNSKVLCMDEEYDSIHHFVKKYAEKLKNIEKYYWRARWQNGLFIRDRVGENLKVDDFNGLATYFKEAKQENLLDTSLFKINQLRELELLLEEPELFCQERVHYAIQRRREVYLLTKCRNKKASKLKKFIWSTEDVGLLKTIKNIIQKIFSYPSRVKHRIKDRVKQYDYTYNSIKSFERGTAARLNELDSKLEMLFWLTMVRENETMSQTKKRVFLNMPKAEGSLRETQMDFMDILQAFDEIMQENGIVYWLTSGTLLGAVRHKGFVPWDDDLDINMLDNDKETLFKVIQASDNLSIDYVYWTAAEYGIQRFPQVRFKYGNKEVWIDIYFWNDADAEPMWDWSVWKKRRSIIEDRKLAYYANIHLLSKTTYKGERLTDEHDKKIIEDIFNSSSIATIKLCRGNRKTIFLTPEIRSVDVKPMVFRYDEIFPTVFVEFEGKNYPAPKETEKFLETQFTDWLSFPKRVNKTHK